MANLIVILLWLLEVNFKYKFQQFLWINMEIYFNDHFDSFCYAHLAIPEPSALFS